MRQLLQHATLIKNCDITHIFILQGYGKTLLH